MRATILLLVFVASFTASGVILKKMETAESSSRGEARANEQSERYEASLMNGAPQYTFVWTSFSLGVF